MAIFSDLYKVKIMSLCFIFWMITEFVFPHTVASQLSLLLFCGASVYDIIMKKQIKISRICILYLLFLCVCLFNIILGYSININESVGMMYTLALNFIFIICLYHYLKNIEYDQILKVMIFSSFVISIVSWIINIYLSGSIMFREVGGINVNGTAILNAFLVAFIIISQKFKQYGIEVIFFIFFCAMSGTRKALLVLILILLIYNCFRFPKKIPKYLIEVCIISGVVYFLLMNVPILYNSIGIRVESLLLYLNGDVGDASIVSRHNFIELGMLYFSNSMIWGNGINCFHTIDGAYGTYSHNNYVELLFSVGILGTLTYYSMYLYSLKNSISSYYKYKNDGAIIGFSIIVCCLITDYAQVVYYDRSTFLFIIYALIVSNRISLRKEN